MAMGVDIGELARFLVKAKVAAYAGDGGAAKRIERPGFKELEFSEGDWHYRDSYAGFFMAPGQEVVRFKDVPVWAMAYAGGMLAQYRPDCHPNITKDTSDAMVGFAKQTFSFLKESLRNVPLEQPFRGPPRFENGLWRYENVINGCIDDFNGQEWVFFKHTVVFRQEYIGGLIVSK